MKGGRYPEEGVYPPGYRQYYPYYPYYPPPRYYQRHPGQGGGISTGKLVALIAGIVAVVVIVPMIIVGIMFNALLNLPTSSGYGDTQIHLTSERNSGGDWILMVQSGSAAASNITLKVISKATGTAVLSSALTALSPPAGSFNDNNYNDRIDAGDTILLRDTATVDPGMEVQLMSRAKLMGSIVRLPA